MPISNTPEVGYYDFYAANLWTVEVEKVIFPDGSEIGNKDNTFGRIVFQKITGLEITSEAMEVIESGSESPIYITRQGKKPSNVTMVRHVARSSSTIPNGPQQLFQGQFFALYERNATITFKIKHYTDEYTNSDSAVIATYRVEAAKLVRWKAPEFDVTSTETAIEELEIKPARLTVFKGVDTTPLIDDDLLGIKP